MKNIVIKEINIKNFMGYANARYSFDAKSNVITAPTGAGKSTILQAVKFAFGLNVSNYQPTIQGYKVKGVCTEVVATINVDGLDYTLKVISEQKWKTNKITEEKEYIGMDNKYIFDGIECKKNVFTEKIETLFGTTIDNILLLVDIKYFNSDNPKWLWANRRKLLFEILNIDNQVAKLSDKDEYNLIANELRKGKDEVDIQKMLNAEKKGIADEQIKNSVRIDDRATQLADVATIDFDSLKQNKEKVQEEIDTLQTNNAKANKNTVLARKQAELQEAIAEKTRLDVAFNSQMCEHNRSVDSTNALIRKIEQDIRFYTEKAEREKNRALDLGMELAEANGQVFDQSKAVCPTCKRPLESNKVSELMSNFEKSKADRLAEINSDALVATENAQNATDRINTLTEELSGLNSKLQGLTAPTRDTEQYKNVGLKIESLKNDIENQKLKDVRDAVSDRINNLKSEYDNIVRELTKLDTMEKLQNEIKGLKAQSRELANQDANRIRKLGQLKNYILEKVSMVNKTVNDNFVGVEFLLTKLNGANAENAFESCCEVMFNGIPYSSQSNGQRIYSDICVGNGLRKLFDINMPMFVDEKQSMTLQYDCWGQVVELITDKNGCLVATMIKDIYGLSDCIM